MWSTPLLQKINKQIKIKSVSPTSYADWMLPIKYNMLKIPAYVTWAIIKVMPELVKSDNIDSAGIACAWH